MDQTFFALPEAFQFPGKVSTSAVESFRKDEVQSRIGRYRIIVELTSNKALAAAFDDEASRDKVFALLDRFLTGKDKVPQYDATDLR